MGSRGPTPTCDCGACRKCRARSAARRRYYGGTFPPLACGRFRASLLALPSEPVTLAYIAGLFDGEGSVIRNGQGRGSWVAQVGMTDEKIIRWLGAMGGTVRHEAGGKRSYDGANRRDLYRWRIMAQTEVEHLLVALMPYLRVKRDVAAAAVAEIRGRRSARDELLALERVA